MSHLQETTIAFAGVLDVRRTAEVRAAVYALLGSSEGDVHVDLADVESLDVTTLKVLVVANRAAERDGRRVVLRHCSPAVRRFLHLSHLRYLIPIEPDQAARAG